MYKQRGPNEFVMVRVRAPGSRWQAVDLGLVARIAEQLGDGQLHFTTRGDVELHGVDFCRVDRVIELIAEAGLTTRGACGDSVRNIVACPGADQCSVAHVPTKQICGDLEVFLRKMEGNGLLPPALRVAISGCPNESSQAGVNDIGFVGATGAYGGRKVLGFELVVGGSTRGEGRLAERIAFLSPEDVIPTFRDLLEIYREFASEGVRFGDFFFEMGAEELSHLLRDHLVRTRRRRILDIWIKSNNY